MTSPVKTTYFLLNCFHTLQSVNCCVAQLMYLQTVCCCNPYATSWWRHSTFWICGDTGLSHIAAYPYFLNGLRNHVQSLTMWALDCRQHGWQGSMQTSHLQTSETSPLHCIGLCQLSQTQNFLSALILWLLFVPLWRPVKVVVSFLSLCYPCLMKTLRSLMM
jgi:hypothetical protein